MLFTEKKPNWSQRICQNWMKMLKISSELFQFIIKLFHIQMNGLNTDTHTNFEFKIHRSSLVHTINCRNWKQFTKLAECGMDGGGGG